MDPDRERWQPRVAAYWEKMFRILKTYKETHDGDCDVPDGCMFEGVNLGYWVQSQRKTYREGSMDPERERRLRDLGFDWGRFDDDWEERFRLLAEYAQQADGHCDVPQKYEVEGIKLGMWVQTQRKRYKEGKMDSGQERRLRELGFKLECWEEDWEEWFRLLTEYKEAHGHCKVPQKYEVEGIKLGTWVTTQRRRYKQGKMGPDQERRLRELGFSLQPLQDIREERFWLLAGYKEALGDCDVPPKYEVNGIKLGAWVKAQRKRYKEGKMDSDQERRLRELGFKLECSWDKDWEEWFRLLAEYKEAHGHCKVPQKYEVEGIKLGTWVETQRKQFKEGKMNPDQERRLRGLGFKWECLDKDWEERFRLLAEYAEQARGHCDVPCKYEVNGIKLGAWVQTQRKRYKEGKMDSDQERRLRELGFKLECLEEDWEEWFRLLAEYKEAHGHCDVPCKYEVEGIKLGTWVRSQRKRHKQGKMEPDQERRLRELGFSLQPLQDIWEERFWLLEGYKEALGDCDVPPKYEVSGIKLGAWVQTQRAIYKEGKMDSDQERRLRELGFKLECWDKDWEERFRLLAEYKEAHGHCKVPQKYEVEGIKLGTWVQTQRQRYKQGKMDADQEQRLRELGVSWQPCDDGWEGRFQLLAEYKEANGHCVVPCKYEVNGVKLNNWVQIQRKRYKEGKMDPCQERRLRELGFKLQPRHKGRRALRRHQ